MMPESNRPDPDPQHCRKYRCYVSIYMCMIMININTGKRPECGLFVYLVTPCSGNFSEMKLQAKVLMDLRVRSVESTVIRSLTRPTCPNQKQWINSNRKRKCGTVKTGNDVHTTMSRTRVILLSKSIGAFQVYITGGFSPRTIHRFIALLAPQYN